MKIIFFPNGWVLAHVSRMVEVAKVLRDRGHEVRFAGEHEHPRSYLHLSRKDGFETIQCMEFDWPYIWDRFLKYGPWLAPWDVLNHQKFAPLDSILDDQIQVIKREEPDMVVCDGTFCLTSAAYITKTPAAAIMNAYFMHFYRPGSMYRALINLWDRFHLSAIRNRIFRKYDTAPVDAKELFWNTRVISPGLADFDSYIKDYEQWEAVGPIWGKLPCDRPAWLDILDDGQTNVYISFGSTGDLGRFLSQNYAVLAQTDYRFIVTTGGQVPSETQAMAPENFLFSDYAPGDEIIKHCAVLIFHGGNGTMYQALAAGVPMLALPHTLEQDINARLCETHGFGIRMKPGRAVGARLMEALQRLFTETSFADSAKRYAAQIAASPGAERAADVILESAAANAVPRVTAPE